MFFLATLFPTGVMGQDPERLTPSDSAGILFAAIENIGTWPDRPLDPDQVAWLRSPPPSVENPWNPPSESVWGLLVARLPKARFSRSVEDLFECPPGVERGGRGQGCPIRDNGRIFWFGPMRIEAADSVMVSVHMVHGAADGAWTQSVGQTLRLARDEEGRWRVSAVLNMSIS